MLYTKCCIHTLLSTTPLTNPSANFTTINKSPIPQLSLITNNEVSLLLLRDTVVNSTTALQESEFGRVRH